MDNSANYYDLLYLVNPAFLNNIEKSKIDVIDNDDLLFYKQRISTLTQDFLNGKMCDQLELNHLFEIYAQNCIEHFKFKDKSNTIQQDYLKYNQKKSTTVVTDISFNNKIIMKQKPQRIPKITDHINVKKKTQKQSVIPKIRKINLKEEKYKSK